jgi:hypothetical protein
VGRGRWLPELRLLGGAAFAVFAVFCRELTASVNFSSAEIPAPGVTAGKTTAGNLARLKAF